VYQVKYFEKRILVNNKIYTAKDKAVREEKISSAKENAIEIIS
jgi:hypothetical protein